MADHYTIPLREVCERLHAERRADETRAMLATAGTTPQPEGRHTSEDGKCLRCRGALFVLERQLHLQRDWCSCSFCGSTMPAVIGSAGEPIRMPGLAESAAAKASLALGCIASFAVLLWDAHLNYLNHQ